MSASDESLIVRSDEIRFRVGWSWATAMQHAVAKKLGLPPESVLEAWCEPIHLGEVPAWRIAEMRIRVTP